MQKLVLPLVIIIISACGTAVDVEQINTSETINTSEESSVPALDETTTTAQTSADKVEFTSEELKLYQLMMDYRAQNNLPSIPYSKSLTYVAQQHCLDLYNNKPDLGDGCNAHSWSDKGTWSACCYTPDHKQAKCIWDKPAEMTSYTGYGYEIACGSSDPQYSSFVMTAEYALQSWKKSSGHNNVILNKENWEDRGWNAVGIGIYKGYACVWFGQESDPAGTLSTK
jgi:uncharacterized protein YkwD